MGITTENYFAPKFYVKYSKYVIDLQSGNIQEGDLSQYNDTIHIFTNGSKSDQGEVSAFCAFEEKFLMHVWNACLSVENSVFHAEPFGIKNAVIWAESFDYKSFLISSDNLSVLMALQNIDTVDYMISEILNLINKSSKTFYFK